MFSKDEAKLVVKLSVSEIKTQLKPSESAGQKKKITKKVGQISRLM